MMPGKKKVHLRSACFVLHQTTCQKSSTLLTAHRWGGVGGGGVGGGVGDIVSAAMRKSKSGASNRMKEYLSHPVKSLRTPL